MCFQWIWEGSKLTFFLLNQYRIRLINFKLLISNWSFPLPSFSVQLDFLQLFFFCTVAKLVVAILIILSINRSVTELQETQGREIVHFPFYFQSKARMYVWYQKHKLYSSSLHLKWKATLRAHLHLAQLFSTARLYPTPPVSRWPALTLL